MKSYGQNQFKRSEALTNTYNNDKTGSTSSSIKLVINPWNKLKQGLSWTSGISTSESNLEPWLVVSSPTAWSMAHPLPYAGMIRAHRKSLAFIQSSPWQGLNQAFYAWVLFIIVVCTSAPTSFYIMAVSLFWTFRATEALEAICYSEWPGEVLNCWRKPGTSPNLASC